jgi:hypothetical protein
MPGFGSIAGVPAAWLSAATVVTGLWIADRLLFPIADLKRTRREIQTSLLVAFSLRETVARLAGKDDVPALNALFDARKDLRAQARRLAVLADRPPVPIQVYAGVRGYDLAQAAQGLRKVSDSLVAPYGRPLVDRAAVEAGLRLGPRYRLARRLRLS